MPLYNTEVEQGKCAFKAIQYMALGIPSVVSPVGANCKVVDDGINGYWADSDTDWYNTLEKLITSYELRNKMGIEAKEKICNQYSVNATAYMFFNLFK
jgi:glycosyltransferase involved in cell wall biosynthesis